MRRKLRRLRELAPVEWPLFFQLVVLSVAIGVALRVVPLPRLTGGLARLAGRRWLSGIPAGHSRHAIRRLEALVDLTVAAAPVAGRCLVRSLVLLWLLKARGLSAELVVGIRKQAEELRGHAWIAPAGEAGGEECEGFEAVVRF